MKKIVNLWLLSCILTLVACGQKAEKQQEVKEDTAANKMLQGICLNDDDEDDVDDVDRKEIVGDKGQRHDQDQHRVL